LENVHLEDKGGGSKITLILILRAEVARIRGEWKWLMFVSSDRLWYCWR